VSVWVKFPKSGTSQIIVIVSLFSPFVRRPSTSRSASDVAVVAVVVDAVVVAVVVVLHCLFRES
jgi:hypothetical protein